MIGVYQDGDRVMVVLTERRRDVLLTCSNAEKLCYNLRNAAALAELSLPQPPLGQTWGVLVESFDGYVAIRLTPPFVGAPDRMPMTPDAARKLADLIDFKKQQAAYRMRFTFQEV